MDIIRVTLSGGVAVVEGSHLKGLTWPGEASLELELLTHGYLVYTDRPFDYAHAPLRVTK